VASNFPFALVAHQKDQYAGHVLAIRSDLGSRPDLSPWIAALWVEPGFREQGIATALMKAAKAELALKGVPIAYLCANLSKRKFYQSRGWKLIDEHSGPAMLDVFESLTERG
jgi:predicted N-acetyltransferase YhbS